MTLEDYKTLSQSERMTLAMQQLAAVAFVSDKVIVPPSKTKAALSRRPSSHFVGKAVKRSKSVTARQSGGSK